VEPKHTAAKYERNKYLQRSGLGTAKILPVSKGEDYEGRELRLPLDCFNSFSIQGTSSRVVNGLAM